MWLRIFFIIYVRWYVVVRIGVFWFVLVVFGFCLGVGGWVFINVIVLVFVGVRG